MVSYENALADLLGLVSPLGAEFQASEDALGGFVAADLFASLDLPPFDASAVDGYALRSEGEGGAPFDLTLLGTMAAGSTQVIPLQPAGCVRVFTGSPLPPSATAVVMQEETCVLDAGRIRFSESVKPWQNVRFRGEDVRKGGVARCGFEVGARPNGFVSCCRFRAGPCASFPPSGASLKWR